MGIKTPRLIRDRCGVYYFRLIVPLSLRDTIGKSELRRSLRTKEAAIARHRALLLSTQLEAVMVDPKFLNSPSIADFPHLLKAGAGDGIRQKMRIDLERGLVETDTPEEAERAAQIVADYAQARKVAAQAGIAAAMPSSRCGTSLEQARDDYIAERKATLSKGTMPKVRGVLGAFIAFAGNADVAFIRASKVKDYKKELLAAGKAATTINDHISILTGFFEYCIDNKVAAMENPAKGLLVKGAQNKAESYDVFTGEELGRIFAPETYLKRMKLPDFYWCPLIALYTGARAEEVASLRVDQIYPVKGIWIIDILKGKTANATRRVPIHANLLALGLVEYRKAVSEAGHSLLFPHLIDGKNGFKKNMGRAFAEHLDSPEVDVKSPLKVFHSFRHTVVTMLTDKGVNDGQKRFLVGHDIDSRTSAHDDYIHGEALTLPNLQEAINRLGYELVDTAKLKRDQTGLLAASQRRIDLRKISEAKPKPAAKKARAGGIAIREIDSTM